MVMQHAQRHNWSCGTKGEKKGVDEAQVDVDVDEDCVDVDGSTKVLFQV